MSGIAALQRHVEDKAQVVLDAYLRSAVSGVSIPGVSSRTGALRVAIGLDPAQVGGSVMTDTLPRVDVYCVAADGDYDGPGMDRDVFYTYEVSAIAQYDESDFSASARSASILCSYACEVLEQYMRDGGGASGCIWRVDTTSPMRTQTQLYDVGEDRLHTMQAIAEVTISARATFADTATYLDPTIAPGKPTIFDQLADITSGLDADTGVGTAEANRSSTWSTTTAALAGAAAVYVDVDPAFAWVAGSTATIYLQRHAATVSGDPNSALTVTLATYDVLDGDRWIIHAADDGTDGTKHQAAWAITWSVS